MVIYVDVDETICDTPVSRIYTDSIPIKSNIDMVNKLYNQGHTIVYWTARGTLTNINWFELTQKQLNKWGCKYHELRMGKPVYDLFIDDKNLNAKDLHNYMYKKKY